MHARALFRLFGNKLVNEGVDFRAQRDSALFKRWLR
jgi:hypothetical protein